MAAVVGSRPGYSRFSVGRGELLLSTCSEWAGFVGGRREVGCTAKTSSTRCDLYLSVQEQEVQSSGHCSQDTSCVLVRVHRGPGQVMVKRCSVMTVSSAPRAPLRRGTKRDSRVDNGA